MTTDKVLVDTSVWIFALKRGAVETVRHRVDRLLQEDRILTTGLIRLELLSGTKTQTEFRRLKKRMESLATIETDNALWQDASELGFALKRTGITVPATDIVIAACGIKAGAMLMHADRHFERITAATQLETENLIPLITAHRQ